MTTPAGPHGTAFSVFDGELVAGIWRLWINDDLGGDGGTVANGQLGIQTDFLPPLMSIDTPTSTATFASTQMFLTVGGEIEDLVGSWAVRWRNVVDGAYYESGAMRVGAPPSDVFEGSVPLRRGVERDHRHRQERRRRRGHRHADGHGVRVRLLPLGGRDRRLFRHQHRRVQARPLHARGSQFTYLPETGPPVTHSITGSSPPVLRIDAEDHVAGGGFSTVVRSTNAYPLAIERNMFWDDTKYGGHGGTAVDAPSTRWLFAEGAQGFFDTYVLLANDNASAVTATVRFLRESGGPVVITPSLAAAQPHDDLGRRRRRRSRHVVRAST